MIELKSAIEIALDNDNNYAALALSMAIPDICGKLEDPEKGSKERFKIWFDKYLGHLYQLTIRDEKHIFMSSSDCYALRCAILHEASEDISKQKAREVLSKIKFTTLKGNHRVRTESVLTLNVTRFCKEICEGIDTWILDIKENQEVMERISLLLKIEDTGFSPFPGYRIEDEY